MRRSRNLAVRSFASWVRPAQNEVYKQLEMFPELKESVDACNQQQFARAVPPLTRMLQVCESISQPFAVEAAWQLGNVYARLGQTELAVKHFLRDPVYGQEQAIRVYFANGDAQKALDLVDQAARLTPEQKELYSRLAKYILKGVVASDHIPTTSAEAVTNTLAAALLIARSELKFDSSSSQLTKLESPPSEDLKAAEDLLVAASNAVENEVSEAQFASFVFANLGELYLALGRTEDAMNILGKSLKLQETISEPLELARTLSLLAVGYHRLGQAVSSEGLFASSLEKYEKAAHLTHVDKINHAKTLIGYGHLLKQWEKREANGSTKLAEGNKLLSSDYWTSLVYLKL